MQPEDTDASSFFLSAHMENKLEEMRIIVALYTLLRTDVRARIRERGIAEGKIK